MSRVRLRLGPHNRDLLFPGDSLTAGFGATSAETAYPFVVARSFPNGGRGFANFGIAGETSTEIKDRVIALSADYKRSNLIIWAGRNDYTAPATVKSNIATMISWCGHDRFLVLSIVNGDIALEHLGESRYVTMTTLNSDLAALYGSRFVDVRTPLVAAGAPAGIAPSPTDYANDVPPAGIRVDTLHYTDAGYNIVANTVYPVLSAFGW